ncbi:alpha-n-acetylgalactosaminidase precursor [Fusarium pseudocircinatum]|uniref:Alpha-galactosidase n=1 Tax=Fusarium pseudocircinatum TaxID=56676 RepID=A0A8H5KG83_9HYPO|nr:alpha-n-acetylgalactosaminidase precursor [Fusarium pseudocircinatum]
MKSLPSILAVAAIPSLASGQSFQSTPVMGWNSYNQVSCSPNNKTIATAIEALSSRGFVDAGYKFFQIDCGWASRDAKRDSTTGALKIDSSAFPDGLKPLSDLARSKGMKWTMYSDAGVHDNCYADNASNNAPKDARTDFVTRFGKMWTELQKVGIPGMLICQWGVPYSSSSGLEGPAEWTRNVSTSFRLSDDIAEGWGNVYRISNQAIHIAHRSLSGPGHIADADLLEVGNSGMTFDEQATHFALWAMLKSALMISTDITALSDQAVAVLQNKDLISINQDAAVKPITLVQRWTSDRDLWAGPLANGDVAVLYVDQSNSARTLSLQLSSLGYESADIKDLWTGKTTTGASSFSKQVNGHGSVALRLSNIKRLSSTANYKYTSISTGSLSSGAKTASCSGCTSSTKVGNVGGSSNGQVVLSNISTSKATQNVLFDYINGDVGFSFTGSTNERLASIKVNGGTAQTVSFPLTGYNWDKDVHKGYAVELSGFNTSGPNTITISGVNSGWAPDFDRLAVVV